MTEPNKIQFRVGVVGCGVMAQIIHLPILVKRPEARVVALCDVNTSKATVVGERFGIDKIYEDAEEMLRREELDVLFILTPTNLHLPIAVMGLKAGCHLFIERPAARNATEAGRIAELAHKVNRVVMVGMQHRFREDVAALKPFLDNRELGHIFLAKVGWLQTEGHAEKQLWVYQKHISGGGVMMDLGIQMLDLLWWLNGRTAVKTVRANVHQINKGLEVEDFISIHLAFANNLVANCEFSWDFPVARDRFYMDLYGEKGSCWLSPLRVQRFWHGQMVNITPEVRPNPRQLFKRSFEVELEHFFHYLRTQEVELNSTIDEAVQVQRIIDAIYQSVQTDKEVSLQ